MTDIEQGDRRRHARDVEVADERADTFAALSRELAKRPSKYPLPPRYHAAEREHSWSRPLWRMGLLSAFVVAVAGFAVMPSGEIRNALERLGWQPAEPSLGASSITTVSTAAAATANSPQPAAPPTDPPTTASAPLDDRTTAGVVQGDPPRIDERELTWTEVHELQIRLRALRFDPGPLDGVKGPLTSAAVRRFQERQGERVTGDIGLRTLILLRQATGAPE